MKLSHHTIIFLLTANLVATIWFGINNRSDEMQNVQNEASKVSHNLPGTLNAKVREIILNRYIENFNNLDLEGLYDMFSPAAKVQFSRKTSDSTFTQLSNYFKAIEEGAFTHSDYSGANGDTRQFVLNYAIKLDESSELTTSGTLKISVLVRDGEYEIYGIHMNSG